MKEDSLMTLLRFELKRSRIALLIWSGSIALLLLICLIIFPDMKGQVNELNAAFSSMGSFTEAFGMDRLNMGELMGFYGLECGNILGIGGAFFAAYIGVSALAGEEKNHTAEYLLTHPISRSRIVIEKLLGIIIQILILNLSAVCVSLITIRLIGETPEMKEFFYSTQLIFSFWLRSPLSVSSSLPSCAEAGSESGWGLLQSSIF